MSTFYAEMAATALELLREFGTSVTLKRTTGASTDPVTGVVTAGTADDQTTTGLLTPFPDRLIDGTRILASDRKLILSPEVRPLMTDKPVIGGQQWSIVQIDTIEPTDTPVVYMVQVRR